MKSSFFLRTGTFLGCLRWGLQVVHWPSSCVHHVVSHSCWKIFKSDLKAAHVAFTVGLQVALKNPHFAPPTRWAVTSMLAALRQSFHSAAKTGNSTRVVPMRSWTFYQKVATFLTKSRDSEIWGSVTIMSFLRNIKQTFTKTKFVISGHKVLLWKS